MALKENMPFAHHTLIEVNVSNVELVYFHNLVNASSSIGEARQRVDMMGHVARHLFLFVSGKMQVAELGEFCCSSKPLHVNSQDPLVS